MVVSSQVSKKPPPSIQLAQLWSWIKIPNISFNSFQLTPTHPPLLISSSVRVSKIEIVQMFIHIYFFFRLYSLTLIVSRLNYYLKGVLSVNASPFPVHVGDKIYLRYLVLDKLRYSQWPSNVIQGSSDIEKYNSKKQLFCEFGHFILCTTFHLSHGQKVTENYHLWRDIS